MLENVRMSRAARAAEPAHRWRRAVFTVLETSEHPNTLSRFVDITLIVLIVASVTAVVLESIESFETAYDDALYWFEVLTICVFTIEYLLRVWSCVENPDAAGNLRTRLRFMVSAHAIIDLLAILPYYLLAFGLFGGFDMRFLRAIRLLRVLKLTRYSAALHMLFVTFRENGRALGASFIILVTVMLLAASGMYYFERQAQPEDFGSIPAAMWWAFATLTTVGYGDVTPITVGGKIFGALIAVVGIGMVALPTSILATGYAQQLKSNWSLYRKEADKALDDGIITEEEQRDLENLRVDLGLGKHTASQILDAQKVQAALDDAHKRCPHCGETV